VSDLPWAAALLEGEGCISWLEPKNPGGKRRLWVTVANTEPVLLERFQRAVGVGKVTLKRQATGNRKAAYRYRASSRQAQHVLEQLYPHLTTGSQKEFKALAAIVEMKSRPRWKEKKK
jgi:hypothetical protein